MFAKFTKALNDAGKDIQRSVDSAVKSISEAEQRERERVKVSDVQYYQEVLRVPVGLPLSGVEFAELLRQYTAAVPVEKERLIKSVGLHQGRAFVCQQVAQLIKADQIPINSVGAAVYCHPRCVDLANWTQVEAAFDVPASRAWCQERIRHATTSAASAQAAVMQQGMPVVVTQPVVVQQGMPVNMSVTPPPMGAAPPGMTVGMNAMPPPMGGTTPGMTVAPTSSTTTVTIAAPMPTMVAPPMAPINTSPQQLSLEMRVANLEATVAALLSELQLTRLAVGIPDPMLVASANAAAAQQAAAANAAAAQQAAANAAAVNAANAAAAQQAAAAAAVTAGALAATGAMVTAGALGAMGATNAAMDASNQVVVADPFVAQANSFALGAPGASFSSTTGDIPGGMFTSSSMTAPIAGGSITESSSAFNQDFGNSHSHGSSHSVSSTQTGQSNFSFGGMNMTGTTTVKSTSSHSESHSSSVSFGGNF